MLIVIYATRDINDTKNNLVFIDIQSISGCEGLGEISPLILVKWHFVQFNLCGKINIKKEYFYKHNVDRKQQKKSF